MNKNLDLFLTFLKIGAFTFGGGYAMIPLIHDKIVDKRKYLTTDEMIDMIAIAESTPGVIAVNCATFVGYKVSKFWGALLATIGVVLPSLILITVIALFFEDFLEITIVASAFRGVRAGVTVLILSTGLKLFKHAPKKAISYILMSIAFFTSLLIEFRYISLIIILFGLVVGLCTQMVKPKESGEDK